MSRIGTAYDATSPWCRTAKSGSDEACVGAAIGWRLRGQLPSSLLPHDSAAVFKPTLPPYLTSISRLYFCVQTHPSYLAHFYLTTLLLYSNPPLST
eukprot:570243-Rhodomonas_salina.1